MKITVVPGTVEHLSDCIEAFRKSKIGEVYYHPDDFLISRFTEGFNNQEIRVAVNEKGRCMGYIWIVINGAFGFPYCSSIAVLQEHRGEGAGTALLNYYEQVGFKDFTRIFILVSDFNTEAAKLYKRLGYQTVGCIPGFFKNGVSENILVKFRDGYNQS